VYFLIALVSCGAVIHTTLKGTKVLLNTIPICL
jgi:hypothetical protein